MKIGIICAMPIELDYLRNHLDCTPVVLKKQTFYLADCGDNELVLVTSGVGKVNATVYTQLLIDYFEPNCVLNIGIAGGLHSDLKPLDIVLGDRYSHHDVNQQQMENLFPNTSVFQADTQLLAKFKMYHKESVIGGIVSGESFIADDSEKNYIVDTFDAVAVDMETSAIAHTCFINDLPFLSIRGISDLANDDATESYENHEKIASDRVGQFCLDVLSQ